MRELDVTDIIVEYCNKSELKVQDVVRCYLKMYEKAGYKGYDRRKNYWNLRPGDVIFVNGSFHPLVSYPRIDETLKHMCIHLQEEELCKVRGQTQKAKKCVYGCRKWYMYYKNDRGRVKVMYPDFDGCTTITKDHISMVLKLLNEHENISELRKHYTVNDHMKVISQLNEEK